MTPAPELHILPTASPARPVQIEIWSDIACPWCYLGKRRFAAALATFPHRDRVEVQWRAYELSPDTPTGPGIPLAPALAQRKGLTVEQTTEMFAHVTKVAAGEGLTYDFDRALAVNTFDAHRLVRLAQERGGASLADSTLEALYAGYFTDGADLGDPQTLVELAAKAGFAAAGLGNDDVRALLAGAEAADHVLHDEAEARALGVTGVPFFVADRQIAVSGAQPVAVFNQLLETAWQQANPLVTLGDGAACTDDSCAF